MARSKILEDVRDTLRLRHYSYRTEKSSVHWIRKFILFHKKRHPAEMGKDEIRNFLTFLARQTKDSASTQNQALSVLLFLYKQDRQEEIGYIDQIERAKKPKRIPVVFSKDEANQILTLLNGK